MYKTSWTDCNRTRSDGNITGQYDSVNQSKLQSRRMNQVIERKTKTQICQLPTYSSMGSSFTPFTTDDFNLTSLGSRLMSGEDCDCDGGRESKTVALSVLYCVHASIRIFARKVLAHSYTAISAMNRRGCKSAMYRNREERRKPETLGYSQSSTFHGVIESISSAWMRSRR